MFITTIVMMLVLAVALTTSSLAWFSSANISVTASSATFYARTNAGSNVSLKISRTTGTWLTSIPLVGGSDSGSMVGVIPTKALVPTVDTAPTFTGLTNQDNSPRAVTWADYKWDGNMVFNSAKINNETSKFVITAAGTPNEVTTIGADGFTKTGSAGVYYDNFFIYNADKIADINALTFSLTDDTALTTTGDQAADTASRAYVAIILYDLATFTGNEEIPDNAINSLGTFDAGRGKTATEAIGDSGASSYQTWIPFAAFTFCVKKDTNDTGEPWQWADLDAQTTPGTFDWNDQSIALSSDNTQAFEGLGGIGAGDADKFTLNTASLRVLNGKSETADTTSEFNMGAGEIFMVSMYAWLDGYSMTEYTDTTVLTVGLNIAAAQQQQQQQQEP